MKEKLLAFISEFNKRALIKIEYAVVDSFLSPSGVLQYKAHLVYSPIKEYLLKSYLSGAVHEGISERTVLGGLALQELKAFAKDKDTFLEGLETPFAEVQEVTISNVSRFYNFKFNSPTDPFLTMFLEPESIVYISEDFNRMFLSQKEKFRPSPIHMMTQISASFSELIKKSTEYSTYSDKVKLTNLLVELHKMTKLYFIAIRYYNTGELISSYEEKQNLILNTLAQAHRPWDFVQDCVALIAEARRKLETDPNFTALITADAEKQALKDQCFSFLNLRLIGELDAERNRNS